jgi:hypothetical protein
MLSAFEVPQKVIVRRWLLRKGTKQIKAAIPGPHIKAIVLGQSGMAVRFQLSEQKEDHQKNGQEKPQAM